MKKRYLFILAMLVFSALSFFAPSISAGDTLDFDDYTNGDQVSESWITTQATAYPQVNSGQARSGLYSYRIGSTSTSAWFNYTDPDFNNLEFWYYLSNSPNDWPTHYLQFINSTSDVLFYVVFKTYGSGASFQTEIEAYDGASSYDVGTYSSLQLTGNWVKIKVTKISSNSWNLSCYDTDGDFLFGRTNAMSDLWSTWQGTTKFTCNDGNVIYWIDDLSYNGIGAQQYDSQDTDTNIEGVNKQCTIGGGGDFLNVLYPYLEQKFHSHVSGMLTTFDLYFDSDYVADYEAGGKHGVELYVNGASAGQYDYVIDMGDVAVLRWSDLGKLLDNEYLVFELYGTNDEYGLADPFPFSGLQILRNPLNRPFETKYHSNENLYSNGLLDGTHLNDFYHLRTCFYYNDVNVFDPYSSLTNEIWTDKYYYTLPDDNDVRVFWNSTINSANIKMYKDGSAVNDFMFPMSIYNKLGSTFFKVYESGSYELRLCDSNLILDRTYFNVSGADVNNLIFTFPNPSAIGGNIYRVYYRYNGTGDCYIFYSEDNNILNGVVEKIVDGDGSLKTGVFYGYYPDDSSVKYIYYYLTEKIGTNFSIIERHKHYFKYNIDINYVKVRSYYSATFVTGAPGGTYVDDINDDTVFVYLDAISEGNLQSVTAYGKHSYLGSNVFLFVDEVNVQNIGLSEDFEVPIIDYLTTDKEYRISIRLISSENVTILANYSLIVTYYDTEGSNVLDIRSLIVIAFPDVVTRVLIGMGIALVITFFPFLASLKMKKSHITINIPSILYAICFGVGVVVSYIVGFFGFEIMFFLCFILAVVIASYYWFGKSKGVSSED